MGVVLCYNCGRLFAHTCESGENYLRRFYRGRSLEGIPY